MLLLFFLTTALSGVISMYLTQESPKISAEYDQRVPVIDISHFFGSERDLQNQNDTPTTKKYLTITLGGQVSLELESYWSNYIYIILKLYIRKSQLLGIILDITVISIVMYVYNLF